MSKPVGVMIVLTGIVISYFVAWGLTHIGHPWIFTVMGAITGVALLALHRRWRSMNLDEFKLLIMAMCWPMTILFSPWMICTQERLRRERIVKEVMEL